MVNNCIYCSHKILYTLKNGHIKCSKCKKKFSPRKVETFLKILQGFCNDINALELSKQLSLNYLTITKSYQSIRYKIAFFCQYEFEKHENYITQYDEYIYLPNNKKTKIEFLYDAQNFLIFDYGKIYTLLLPFSSKYHIYDTNPKELKKFLTYNKIAKLNSQQNTIKDFCIYLEKNITKYKGISNENFNYYLKEMEFKYNYPPQDRFNILIKLMYDKIIL